MKFAFPTRPKITIYSSPCRCHRTCLRCSSYTTRASAGDAPWDKAPFSAAPRFQTRIMVNYCLLAMKYHCSIRRLCYSGVTYATENHPSGVTAPTLVCSAPYPGSYTGQKRALRSMLPQWFCADRQNFTSFQLLLQAQLSPPLKAQPRFPGKAPSCSRTLPEKSASGLNLRFQLLLKSELKFSPKLQAPQVISEINKRPPGQLRSPALQHSPPPSPASRV